MKIAAVTDDKQTISAHFGRATAYAVMTIEDGEIVEREYRSKVNHRDFQREGEHDHEHHHDSRGRGFGQHAAEKHNRMFATIKDCQVLLARGMGRGAYMGLGAIWCEANFDRYCGD